MLTELPSASPLNHVVQVRSTLPSSSSAIPTSRGLAVDPNGDPMAITEDGFHWAVPSLTC
ncbi:BQ5605_C040g11918 [Microbotryum silenes-dioicae]|uniref:BQ5605_C040g11918 protein n=1 Tax=Microbotryum silenes-dioicae TaxID=796604 RepID=A0A2X0PJ30_9BASI|nr:BQ5605_C040g11918 [Microbotryum silenes-dioicae]